MREWEGAYLDGKTAARRRAVIRIQPHGLHLEVEGGAAFFWPYAEVRQTQGFYAGEQARLERGGDLPEVLEVADPAFLDDLRRMAPERGARFHGPPRPSLRVMLVFLTALGVIALSVALYQWGIPAVAAFAAERVPVAWEESLGRSVAAELAPQATRCTDPARQRVLEAILATLTRPLTASPYTFRLVVVDNAQVNAFAVPGGYVVILRGLLERTESAEELAGVLAHELQHVLLRHSTRAIFQEASTGLLMAALVGDATGAIGYGLESARTLGRLRYTRRSEEEADERGLRMLVAAHVDPQGLLRFFEEMKKAEGRQPGLFRYLSSHPTPAERLARLRALAAELDGQPVKLLPDEDWRAIARICQAR